MLRIPVANHDDILAIVDTAFSGELLLDEVVARSWGVIVLDVDAMLELGDGSKRIAKQGLLTFHWLGEERDVTVQVVPRAAEHDERGARRDGEPIALLGTELLANAVLTVNFPAGRVTVRQSD